MKGFVTICCEAFYLKTIRWSINVNYNDLIEVKYLDDKNVQKIELFSSNLELSKEFIRKSKEKNFTVISVAYYIELMISETGSHIARQPGKRFGEQNLSPEEFLMLSNDWVKNTRKNVEPDIDSYMAENFGAKYIS